MGPTGRSRIVQIHPTRRCNLRCLHCYSSSSPEEREEIPLALLRGAVSDAAAEGYDVIGFSGGEPLLYKPLPELLGHAHELGLKTTVTTNGMLLDERRLAALAGRADLVAMSLDGVPASHDRMRGDPRAFKTLASRLPGLRAAGIPFGFIFTLTQTNLDELQWVAAFALAQGASLLQIHPLAEVGRALAELPGERPDAIEASYAFLFAEQLQAQVGDRLRIQLDLVSRRGIGEQPERFLAGEAGGETAEGCQASAAGLRLADLVSPLIIEPDGAVVPLEYGFARAYALGNLYDAPLAGLARGWRQGGEGSRAAAFRRLCRRTLETVAEKADAPLANWFEEVREQSAVAAV